MVFRAGEPFSGTSDSSWRIWLWNWLEIASTKVASSREFSHAAREEFRREGRKVEVM